MKILNIIIAAGLLIASATALAHTGIKSTSPENKAVLQEAPETLTMSFRAPVRLMKVTLLDNNEEVVKTDFKPTAKAAKTFSVELPELSAGKYQASWMIMGKDGHKIKGRFVFTVDNLSKSSIDLDHLSYDGFFNDAGNLKNEGWSLNTRHSPSYRCHKQNK